MKVIVLGAGVVGVVSAYFLARCGHQVVVLEKNSTSAMGCSYANGGQLSYSHIETWAAKSSLFSFAKAAVKPKSYLSFSLFPSPQFQGQEFFKWFCEFYKNSSPKISQENSKNLFTLSSYSKKVLEEILSYEKGINFEFKREGILHFYRTQKAFDEAIKEAQVFDSIGRKINLLTAKECVAKEPNLVRLFDDQKLAGGIFYEIDESGNSLLFTRSLEKICREKYGVVFEYNTDIKNILTNHKKITGINTSKGVHVANKYVYALGAYGTNLLNGVGFESKIYPLKGYSLSIQCNEEFSAPTLALSDPENKVVYSRLGNTFRIGGSVEISDQNTNHNQKNINFLRANIRSTFAECGNINNAEEWCGARPFRPNSLPLIGEVKKYGNLLINSGHGSLGWTLAAASGKILADLVIDKQNSKFSFLEKEFADS